MTTEEIVERCRWAVDHNEGRPSLSWSAGQQVAVALVLDDRDHLAAMGYTVAQAIDRVAESERLSAFELTGWLADIRTAVGPDHHG